MHLAIALVLIGLALTMGLFAHFGDGLSRRAKHLLALYFSAALLVMVVVAYMDWRWPIEDSLPVEEPLVQGETFHEHGLAYYFHIPLFASIADNTEDPFRSPAVLCEDDRPLGPAHALHDEIRKHGAGRFSHWFEHVFFSTPDGSDPRTNLRRYWLSPEGRCRPPIFFVVVDRLKQILAGLRRIFSFGWCPTCQQDP